MQSKYYDMKCRILPVAAVICAVLASCSGRGTILADLSEWDFCTDSLSWEQVSVPHSYNAIDGHSVSYYRGKGWYRRTLHLTAAQAAGDVSVCFEGAAQKAEVWVNGSHVCSHKGGYTAFFADLTGKVKSGDNELLVICDNSADMNLAPVDSDFNKNGGLHNPATLYTFAPAHFSTAGYGRKRLHVTTHDVSVDAARVEMKAAVSSREDDELTAVFTICDAAGRTVDSRKVAVAAKPIGDSQVSASFEMSNPHLWGGVGDPYLYTAAIELRSGRRVLDRVETCFGVRWFELDPDKGFFLNGLPYALRGTSIHQDMDGKATALCAEDYERDYGFVKELGCNFVRLAHYPHNDIAFDICDRLGIIVQTEIPWVNVCGVEARPEYFANLHEQMGEMVRNLYNHPSIVFWGMWNELAGWGNRPSLQGRLDAAKVVEVTASLYDLAKSIDPQRLVGITDCQLLNEDGYPGLKTDYVSENRYNGWYYGTFDKLTGDIESVKAQGFAVNISEYGAGVNPYCHSWNAEDIGNKDNARHFEEWGNLFHESHLQQIEQMPYLGFTSIWILFDFPVAARQEGYMDSDDGINFTENESRRYTNDKGLVTRDRKLRKDAFYLYKARWNASEVTVYIAGKRLAFAPEGMDYQVKVYSNADSLTLYRGDEKLQTLESSGEASSVIWTFSPVRLLAGENNFRVVSSDGTEDVYILKSI